MRTLLVSRDLTIDEKSAAGGHRWFVPHAPAPKDFVLWTPVAETTCEDELALLPLKLERNRQTFDVMLLARRLKAA